MPDFYKTDSNAITSCIKKIEFSVANLMFGAFLKWSIFHQKCKEFNSSILYLGYNIKSQVAGCSKQKLYIK